MRYNFSEKNLPSNFRSEDIKQISTIINAGSSLTIIGMPYVGLVPFFRYLVMTEIAYFVLLDVHSLLSPTKYDLFSLLYKELGGKEIKQNKYDILDDCKRQLQKLLKTNKKIVIIINQINYLKSELHKGLLLNLRTLEDLSKAKVLFIISATKPLYEYRQLDPYERSIGFASKKIYFSPYTYSDIKKRVGLYPTQLQHNHLERVFFLSGGNSTLFHILLKSNHISEPLHDDQTKFHLEQIYNEFTTNRKSQLRKIAFKKRIKEVDPFLIKIGLVKELGDNKYELFTPLLRDYILKYTHTKLTRKERKLFALLKKARGQLVSKDTIITEIWESSESATDWALNSLIYRLRKNQSFINQGYVIENEKDEGYRMIKES
jgi:hypothetical protein